MKIDEVIKETIIAIYRDPEPSVKLFLKGGSAMRLFDNLTSRLFIDIDFSIDAAVDDENNFFNTMKSKIGRRFRELKFDTIDFKWIKKTKEKEHG